MQPDWLVNLTPEGIAARLRDLPPAAGQEPFPDGFFPGPASPAAILIPLTRVDQEWRLVFIRRTANENDRHSGQVAFPGGRMEPQDASPAAAAMREAEEEIGLHPEDARVLGLLPARRVISNFFVTPVVGLIPWPYPFCLMASEVSRVFTIPLGWLAAEGNSYIQERVIPPYRPLPVIYFQPYEGETLWGFSAQVTVHLLAVLKTQSRLSKPIESEELL